MANVRLRVLGPGSLGTDGHRIRPYPADVHGRFMRARRIVYLALIALWAALPWIDIGGHPAVFLDIDRRSFYLFGAVFNAQDIWLTFFAITGFGFALVVSTALLGRAWCGWACPQTVFIETLFRPIERLVNGPRNTALRRAQKPWDFDRVWRTALTHVLYLVAALFVAHVFVAYFVSLPKLFAMMTTRPAAHLEVFAWMLGSTTLFYVAFGLFREQFCVVMCPYGRLQSTLLDDDALVVGYDETRMDCVDCKRCVVVCPTGIDIRQGLQLDCIACTSCIDACDEVMDRLGRPRGLVRYDSLRGLRGERRRFLRPRLYVYGALLVVGVLVATLALRRREPFEANLLRLPGAPWTREGDTLRNAFEVHLVNKRSEPVTFTITADTNAEVTVLVPLQTVEIEPLGNRRIPIFATASATGFGGNRPVVVHVASAAARRDLRGTFLGAP